MVEIPSTVRRTVRKYVQTLIKNGTRVQQILLYGSHANKTAHVDSDIDIIVISEDFGEKNLLERLQILARAQQNMPDSVQAYGFTPKEVQNRELTAFWEEIVEEQAIDITQDVLPERRRVASKSGV